MKIMSGSTPKQEDLFDLYKVTDQLSELHLDLFRYFFDLSDSYHAAYGYLEDDVRKRLIEPSTAMADYNKLLKRLYKAKGDLSDIWAGTYRLLERMKQAEEASEKLKRMGNGYHHCGFKRKIENTRNTWR